MFTNEQANGRIRPAETRWIFVLDAPERVPVLAPVVEDDGQSWGAPLKALCSLYIFITELTYRAIWSSVPESRPDLCSTRMPTSSGAPEATSTRKARSASPVSSTSEYESGDAYERVKIHF
jgi:hypothetical protein